MTALPMKVQPSFSYAAVWPGGACKSWQDAAFYYGNVPRSVFSNLSDAEKVNTQLTSLTLTKLSDLNGSPTTTVHDWLVELIPTSPHYTTKKYRYRPGFVTDEIAFKQLAANLDEWERIVNFTSKGHMFEAVLHRFLAKFPEKLRLDDMWSLHPTPPPVKLSANAELRNYWPKAASWRAVPFSPDQITSLKHGVYYYPTKPNFAVVDSFLFLRPQTTKIVLVCFQITLQTSHETKGRTLQKFIAEFDSSFTLDELKLSICAKAAGLTLQATSDQKSASYALELHLIYLTKDSTFAHQALQDGVKQDKQLWSRIKQYCCSTKSFCK